MTISGSQGIDPALLNSQIGVRVARKTLDAQQQQGDAAVSLIRAAAELAKSINTPEGRLDVMA